MTKQAIVVGCDRLSLRVAECISEQGHHATVAAGEPTDTEDRGVRARLISLDNASSHIHYSSDDAVTALQSARRAGVTISAVVLCTESDVVNVRDALALRRLDPDLHIVMRVFNTRFGARLPEVLGSVTVLSATKLAAAPLADLAVGHGGPTEGPVRRGASTRLADRIRGSYAVAIWRQLWRRSLFRYLLATIVLLIGVETLVIANELDRGLLASFHSAAIAVLTTGFVDVGVSGVELAQSPWYTQLGSLLVLVVDAAIVAVLFGLVADALIGERFARVFGGSARRMRGHVVVAGLGTTGHRLVRELTDRGYRCMAIEASPDSPFIGPARQLGVGVVIADVRQEDEFGQLGLDRAIAFLGVTDDDAANLEAGLTASSISPSLRVVMRMFDTDLAHHVEQLPNVVACRSVTRLAARRSPRQLSRGSSIGRMDLAHDSSRQLIDSVLPPARREYIAAWEFLADATHSLSRRRTARERAVNGAEQHELVADVLTQRAEGESGETRKELQYLAGELIRLAGGLRRIATLSPHAISEASDGRPEAVGCGRKYRNPARAIRNVGASRAAPAKPKPRAGKRPSRPS